MSIFFFKHFSSPPPPGGTRGAWPSHSYAIDRLLIKLNLNLTYIIFRVRLLDSRTTKVGTFVSSTKTKVPISICVPYNLVWIFRGFWPKKELNYVFWTKHIQIQLQFNLALVQSRLPPSEVARETPRADALGGPREDGCFLLLIKRPRV